MLVTFHPTLMINYALRAKPTTYCPAKQHITFGLSRTEKDSGEEERKSRQCFSQVLCVCINDISKAMHPSCSTPKIHFGTHENNPILVI